MMRRQAVLVLFCAWLLICAFPTRGAASTKTRPATALDPCSLLTREEIESVQGETVSDMKSSRPESGLFAVSQCFYTLPTFSKSISLEITRKDRGRTPAPNPRDQWSRIFHEESGRSEREAGEEEKPPPRAIAGVGDEAFWTASGVGGALYVLKGDTYLRISIGGPDEQAARIEKSKALARKALARL
jgi:hypothetical protein